MYKVYSCQILWIKAFGCLKITNSYGFFLMKRKKYCFFMDWGVFYPVLNCTRIVPELYLNRTYSVHSSVRSTFRRRNCGLGTEQVRLGYGEGGEELIWEVYNPVVYKIKYRNAYINGARKWWCREIFLEKRLKKGQKY